MLTVQKRQQYSALIEYFETNLNAKAKSQTLMSRSNSRNTSVLNSSNKPKKVLILETMPKKSISQKPKSGYDPAKVRAERAKRGQNAKFSGLGKSTIVTPKEVDRYDSEYVKSERQKREAKKTSTSNSKEQSRQPNVIVSKSKMSSGYDPAKARAQRAKTVSNTAGNEPNIDIEKHMFKR